MPLSILMIVAFVKIILIIAKIISIILAFSIMAPPIVTLLKGFFYLLQLCMDQRKSVLVLQVGVLDKMRELQRELAQITDTSNSDGVKLDESLEVLWTPETEDEVVSKQELYRDFPLLKPVDPSGFEGHAIDS
ncbi:hypothetical protein OROHE_005304 [Orobanche hederae]